MSRRHSTSSSSAGADDNGKHLGGKTVDGKEFRWLLRVLRVGL